MDGSIAENNVSVLEALQPNKNLKRLTIENYNGNIFPTWLIRGCDLPKLTSLTLINCSECEEWILYRRVSSAKRVLYQNHGGKH